MEWVETIGGILLGAVCFYAAFATKNFYTGLPGMKKPGRPVPRWFGQTWCCGIGLLSFYMALKRYF